MSEDRGLVIARSFAAALDEEDYEAAQRLMHPDCVYIIDDRRYHGPDAIAASYRASSERARSLVDEVAYQSEVEPLGDSRYAVSYVDRLRLGDRRLDHRSLQIVEVDGGERIVRIADQNVSGERQRLLDFLSGAGIDPDPA